MNSQTLEQELFNSVRENTPEYIKNNKYIDIDNKNEFIIRSYRYNEMKNLQFNSKAILEEL